MCTLAGVLLQEVTHLNEIKKIRQVRTKHTLELLSLIK